MDAGQRPRRRYTRRVLSGIAFAVLVVLALMRALRATASFSQDFRTLRTPGETFRVDWATGIIRELNQSMEKYRPVAQELSPALGGPGPDVPREPLRDSGVRYHNVTETFVLEHPGGRLPFRFREAQGAVGHHYFYESEGKRLTAVWITRGKESTGRLLALRTELRGKNYDAAIEHPVLAETRKVIQVTSPIGLLPAFGLGWILGSQLIGRGFLAGAIGAAIVGAAYFIALSWIEGRHRDRFDREEMSALREFVGQAHTAPLDPTTAPG